MNTKISFIVSIFFLCWGLSGSSASSSERKRNEDFEKQYGTYKEYVRAGSLALNKKRYKEAVEQYNKAIEISPFVASHYYQRGQALYKKGDKGKAIEDFDKVITLDPRHAHAYVYRGLCRMKRGEYKAAVGDYLSALKLRPKDASIHNNLPWLYATVKIEKLKDKAKALEHAKKAANLSKERNAEILDTLAKAYYINGKVKEAVQTQKKALKIEPGNEAFKRNLEEYSRALSAE